MNRWQAFSQLLLARLREFYREPQALFWVYGFPILLAIGLGLAFASHQVMPPHVDIIGELEQTQTRQLMEFLQEQGFPVSVQPRDEALARLYGAKTDIVLDQSDKIRHYHYDKTRSESVMALHWLEDVFRRREEGASPPPELVSVDKPGNRYIDFLIPGLMGLNLMGGGLWGVGFVIVDMRIRKLLKRMMATPMRRSDYLLAIMSARMILLVPDMLILVVVGHYLFGVPIYGDLLLLLLVIIIGSAAFSGLGLLVASRTDKTETVSGLMNLIMLPMWLMSGTFFSSERFPAWMQPFIQALPLTQLNNALRGVMLHNASITEIAPALAILSAWAVVCFFLGLWLFKWR